MFICLIPFDFSSNLLIYYHDHGHLLAKDVAFVCDGVIFASFAARFFIFSLLYGRRMEQVVIFSSGLILTSIGII